MRPACNTNDDGYPSCVSTLPVASLKYVWRSVASASTITCLYRPTYLLLDGLIVYCRLGCCVAEQPRTAQFSPNFAWPCGVAVFFCNTRFLKLKPGWECHFESIKHNVCRQNTGNKKMTLTYCSYSNTKARQQDQTELCCGMPT